MQNQVGVENYDLFDPGFSIEDDLLKKSYLTRNILPRLKTKSAQDSILEIGPGRGTFIRLLAASGFANVEAFEVSIVYAEKLRENGIRVTQGPSATSFLEESKRKWDIVILIDVLEHLDREEGFQLLETASRALKPGGEVILQLPNCSGLFGSNTFFADFTHRTGYNEHSLRSLLQASGFSRIQMFPLELPSGLANTIRSQFRKLVFVFAKLLTRIVGATPVMVLTHNLIATAKKAD